MAEGSVMLFMPQMIDLALSSPEAGAVNFNILHALLHVMVQQLELHQCSVEFRGNDGDRVQNMMTSSKPAPSINLTEYVVTPGKDAGKIVKRKRGKKKKAKKDDKEVEGADQAGVIDADNLDDDSLETVILVEPGLEAASPYIPVAISKTLVDSLQEEVGDLRAKVEELAELPANAGLIEAIRNAGDKTTPMLEMFQMMSLSKRMDANEESIRKLVTIIEDLAKERGQGSVPGLDQVVQLGNRTTNVENFMITGEKFQRLKDPSAIVIPVPEDDKAEPSTTGVPAGQGGSPTTGGVGLTGANVTTDVPDFTKMSPEEFARAVGVELKKVKIDIKVLYDRLGGLAGLTDSFTPEELVDYMKVMQRKYGKGGKAGKGEAPVDQAPEERLTDLEDKFNDYVEQMSSLDAMFNNEINSLQNQFSELEKELGSIVERIKLGLPGGDAGGESLGELYEKIMVLQTDMENLAETATKLMEDKEEKQRIIEALLEQIELLKTIKADKEDLEDALADKADACAINRKVSHDQFDTACDELSKGIEEALGKLTLQENLWQQALDEIQKEIGNKLDRMELGPLRDFVNNKLKMLQQRLKALTALKKETEAAGSKKFLRNVNCISCDKDVVMRKEMDPSLLPQPYSMPPSRSMGPYLAYELDALRKQQKSLPTSRNLNHFENAMASSKSPRDVDHVCNRYCGGSHTVTTPQQRVTRLGHFLNQWGPETQSVSDNKIPQKDDDKLAIQGDAVTPRASKTKSVEPLSARRESVASKEGSAKRVSSATDKKPSVASLEKRVTGSASKSSATKSVSPKHSGEGLERRRSSQGSQKASAGSQKLSQGSIKRSSQGIVRSGSAIAEERVASRLSAKIPEETASEVAEADADNPPPPSTESEGEEPSAEAPTETQTEEAVESSPPEDIPPTTEE